MTPLYAAAFQNHTDVVNYLIQKGANVNIKNKNGVRFCVNFSNIEFESVWDRNGFLFHTSFTENTWNKKLYSSAISAKCCKKMAVFNVSKKYSWCRSNLNFLKFFCPASWSQKNNFLLFRRYCFIINERNWKILCCA